MKTKYFLKKIQYAAFALVVIATLLASTNALAAEGALDPTFGTNGVVVTDLGSSSDTAINIVLQPDGKIIMAGSGSAPTIVRYNLDGTLDPTFGASGILTAAIGGPVALQPNGKLIVGGALQGGFGVARYNSNGALDTTFGTNGIGVAGRDDNFYITFGDLAVQPDGKIVVVGTQVTGGHTYPCVIARFNENGTLDEDFRMLAFDDTNFPGGLQHFLKAVAIQSDGKIVMSGNMMSYEGDSTIILGRMTTGPEPWLDPAFGTNGHGTVVTPLAGFSHGRGAIAIQADGKIVIAGTVYGAPNDNLVLARYTSNGTLDTMLAGSGIVITDLGGNEVGNDVAIQGDGKILVVGEGSSGSLLLRYNSDGSLDPTFGDAGKVIGDLGGNSIAIQPDGKILTAGGRNGDAILARFSGTPPPTETETFKSKAAPDGWILESQEFSNAGGLLNKVATTFNVGDDQNDKQYRSIVSFNTASLPDNAIVTAAQVNIKRQGLVGTDPFTTHGALLLEIRNGLFSNDLDLRLSDFAAPASSSTPDTFTGPLDSWYTANLGSANVVFINKYGITQFRLRFDLDDNDDLGSDYMKFFSGDALEESNHPQLIVTYFVP
jgi:uncharacterized delta-60 repeat protein